MPTDSTGVPRPDTAPQPVALAPGLPLDRLQSRFAATGRVHVPGVLAPGGAERLHDALRRDIGWQTAFRHGNRQEGGRHVDLSREQVALLDRTRLGLLADAVNAQARSSFAYVYNSFPIADTAPRPDRPDSPGHRAVYALFDFLNRAPFLEFVRQLTGLDRIARADAQATLFHAGHFLTTHDDDVPGQDRLAAYVLNLTPSWSIDWGGLLAFHGADGHVAEAFTPSFNALNLFKVPMRHCVTYVAPFCPAGRYSITGWLRSA